MKSLEITQTKLYDKIRLLKFEDRNTWLPIENSFLKREDEDFLSVLNVVYRDLFGRDLDLEDDYTYCVWSDAHSHASDLCGPTFYVWPEEAKKPGYRFPFPPFLLQWGKSQWIDIPRHFKPTDDQSGFIYEHNDVQMFFPIAIETGSMP